jgi:hypothetical protein
MPVGTLWILAPAEVLLLSTFLAGFLLLIRLRRLVVKLLGVALVLPNLLLPNETPLREFPSWATFILLACVALPGLRRLMAVIVGRRATDAIVGVLAVDLLRLTMRAAFLPMRMVWQMLCWIVR